MSRGTLTQTPGIRYPAPRRLRHPLPRPPGNGYQAPRCPGQPLPRPQQWLPSLEYSNLQRFLRADRTVCGAVWGRLGKRLGPCRGPPGGFRGLPHRLQGVFFPTSVPGKTKFQTFQEQLWEFSVWSGLVWPGLVWYFLCCVAALGQESLADRQGAVTTWLVSSPSPGACQQTRPHWRHQALNQTRPQRPSSSSAATKIRSRRRATDDDEGCFSHFRS